MEQARALAHEPARKSMLRCVRALARAWIIPQPLATLRVPPAGGALPGDASAAGSAADGALVPRSSFSACIQAWLGLEYPMLVKTASVFADARKSI
jgi:hypothetical protein